MTSNKLEGFVDENCTVQKLCFSKNLRCMSRTQRFEKAHESKYGVRPAKKGL